MRFTPIERKSIALVLACAMLAAMALLAGCGKEKPEEKPVLVKTQRAGAAHGTAAETFSGTVHGRYETNLSFQVGGQILSRNVEVGSRVQAGDVLMAINAKDVIQRANQGDAQVASARAQLKLAQANLVRYSQLYEEEAVPAAVRDQYQTNYDAAFAAYQQALAQAAQGHNSVGYTNLTAGADGVISSIAAEEGQVVAAGQTVMTLVQTDELEIEIAVPESRLAEVAVGTPAEVTFWALRDAVAEGTVREVAPMADAASRTYKVRVSVPDPPAGLKLGMTASVAFAPAGSDETGIELPLTAIYQTGDAPAVWVVGEDRTVSLKEVHAVSFGKDSVRVTGLAPDAVVVTAGVHRLREGQAVRLEADE